MAALQINGSKLRAAPKLNLGILCEIKKICNTHENGLVSS